MSTKNIRNNPKILILGSKGNLGQQLVKVFQKQNNVIKIDKNDINIIDKKSIIKKIQDLKPNIIINATAYNAVDKCEEDVNEFKIAKQINGDAVEYLAQAALAINATLIHYSSDYVFDGKQKQGYKESDKPNPISKYGESKLIGEKNILKYRNQNLKYYIIRTSKLFNPVETRFIASKSTTSKSKPSFFDIMLKLAKEKPELKVVNEETSCFTYAPDLAKVTLDLIHNKKKYGIYHITNSDPCTWYEAVIELFKITNIKTKVIPVASSEFPRPAQRPAYSVLLNTKLPQLRSYKDTIASQ